MVPDHSSEPPTRLIWLLGHPVAHSLSPRLHNAAFRHQGLDFRYLALDVLPEQLSDVVSQMRSLHVHGANVTIPHKEAVMPLLDCITPEATGIGAVNTIVNDGGQLRGHNTDLAGFGQALRTILPAGAKGLSCLVVGAGGAAKAAVTSLLADGPQHVWVTNRTLERAVAVCASMAEETRELCIPLALDQAQSLVGKVDLYVNATPVGLPDSVKDFPLAVDTLHSGQVLVDVVYGIEPTPLVLAAREKGALAIDGTEMLLQQAARSYHLWTGREAPLEVMRESITGFEG